MEPDKVADTAASAETPLTEDDAAKIAESLETLTLLGKAPGPTASAGAAASAPDAPAAGAAGGAGGSAPAAAGTAKDAVEMALFGGRRAKAAAASAVGPDGKPEHKFWSTQPVLQDGKEPEVEYHGPIDAPKTIADVRAEPYGLPEGFTWCTIDTTNEAELTELFELLRDNYVEDDDAMFRFAYARDFLRWALTPPGYKPDWIVGVRSTKGGRLFASITGIPADISSYGKHVPMCEINFLCVHKKLRSKRLAPVLIKEVTRRVNLTGVWQATYTAGVVLPKPVARCQYWHRSIQPKKLIEVGFSRLAPRMTLARTIRLYQLPDVPAIAGIRPATAGDVPAITRLINAYLPAFSLHPVLSEAEVAHWLLPRDGVIDSFVVDANHAAAAPGSGGAGGGAAGSAEADDALLAELEGPSAGGAGGKKGKGGKGKAAASGSSAAAAGSAAPAAAGAGSAAAYVHPISGSGVTDFMSFYHLPSSIIGHDKHKVLRAVYSYYMVPGGSPHLRAATEAAASAGAAAAAPAKKGDAAPKHGHTLEQIMDAALVLAKQREIDVFNALDLMENDPAVLKELKFGPGDGHLQYYLYNWACPEMPPKGNGLVLL